MAVKIDHALDCVLLMAFLEIFPDAEGLRRQLFDGVGPLPVEIYTCQIASGVAVDDAVRIHHWDHDEVELLPQLHKSYRR